MIWSSDRIAAARCDVCGAGAPAGSLLFGERPPCIICHNGDMRVPGAVASQQRETHNRPMTTSGEAKTIRDRAHALLSEESNKTTPQRADTVVAFLGPSAAGVAGWLEIEADAHDRDLRSGKAETLRELARELEEAIERAGV